MLKRLPALLFPFILALFPAVSLYVHNLYQIRFHEVAWSLVAIFFLVLVFIFVFFRLYRDLNKAAIAAATFFLLLFSFGHVNASASYLLSSLEILEQTKFLVRGGFADILWLLIWILFLATILFLLYRYKKDLHPAVRFLSVVAYAVGLVVITQWIYYVVRHPSQQLDAWVSQFVEASPYKRYSPEKVSADSLPDVYYIILDALGSEEVLKTEYNADLSGFRDYLEREGFYVASQSRSNYAWTELSLASSLNFEYLDELGEVGSGRSDTLPLEIMVEHNHLFEIFHKLGYKIVTFSDEYELTDITSSDVYLAPQGWVLNGYQNELINTTPLPAVFRVFSLKTPYDRHRDHLLYMFDHLTDGIQEENQPRFVFAHFMAPHPPFVFGANGEPVSSEAEFTFNFGVDQVGREGYISGYRGQAEYMTQRITKELDKILARKSGRPVIIIIQGDHGPGLGLDWSSLQNTDLNERMSIFNAYYFPDGSYQNLNPQMTPVNSFRVVLNQYFGFNLPILRNKNYFTLVYRPFDFLDVTGSLLTKAGK